MFIILVMHLYYHRFLRREKEIAESRFEVSQAESIRLTQKCEQVEKQLEEAQENLSGERARAQVRGIYLFIYLFC